MHVLALVVIDADEACGLVHAQAHTQAQAHVQAQAQARGQAVGRGHAAGDMQPCVEPHKQGAFPQKHVVACGVRKGKASRQVEACAPLEAPCA